MPDEKIELEWSALMERMDAVRGIGQGEQQDARAFGYADRDQRTFEARINAGLWLDNC